MFKIVIAPNPVLSTIAKPISKINSAVVEIINEMKKTLAATTDPKGVGLAAPQVGKSLRIFIAKPTDKSKISVFINPAIIKISTDQKQIGTDKNQHLSASKSVKIKPSKKLEGCLSLPTIWGPVLRTSSLILQYQLITNNHQLITKTHTFTGFMATIIQHEMDHLDGILFPKRVLEQKGILYKSSKNAKGEDEFEEIEI